MQCSNNLKQIGLAIHGFHEANGCLPASRLPAHYGTWATELWPYLEQRTLADNWLPELCYHDQPEENRQAQVPIYLCPSRRRPPQISKSGDGRGDVSDEDARGALGDYGAVVGDSGDDYVESGNGPFLTAGSTKPVGGSDPHFRLVGGVIRHTNFAMIRDGMSNTIFVGEKHVPTGRFGIGRPYSDSSIYNGDNLERSCRFAGPGYGLARSPNEGNNGSYQIRNFGSYHPGVCLFVFGDGSVRSLANSIDTQILGYLAVRNDGQVIPGDAIQ